VEALIAIIYLSSGIIILSAFCLSIAYHFQTMHYLTLKQVLHATYVKYSSRRQKQGKASKF
jgi:hypothetical protein